MQITPIASGLCAATALTMAINLSSGTSAEREVVLDAQSPVRQRMRSQPRIVCRHPLLDSAEYRASPAQAASLRLPPGSRSAPASTCRANARSGLDLLGRDVRPCRNPSHPADVPFQVSTSTFACARSAAAARIGPSSNCASASLGQRDLSYLEAGEMHETDGRPATIAVVTGSRVVLDDGVSMPRRMRSVISPDWHVALAT